jgi:hypothetical protein
VWCETAHVLPQWQTASLIERHDTPTKWCYFFTGLERSLRKQDRGQQRAQATT